MMRRVRMLLWKELIELGQDPRLFGIVIIAPIAQLVLLAYAATTDVRNVPVVFADADRSTASRELISRFDRSTTFTVLDVVTTGDEVEPFLARGVCLDCRVHPAPVRGRDCGAAGRKPCRCLRTAATRIRQECRSATLST